jgi:hypothetical protein
MKYIFLLLITFTLSSYGTCQEGPSDNIYLKSLQEHIEYIKSVNQSDVQSVYVEENDITTTGLPKNIGDVDVIYLSKKEIRNKTKNGKRIHLIVIKPVQIGKRYLKVNLIDFFVTSKRNSFNYANSGGSTFEFRYNCEKEEIELFSKNHSGI